MEIKQGDWIVVRENSPFGWARFGATEAGAVTAKQVKFARRGTCWGRQARLDHVIAAFADRQEAEHLAQALHGVAGEFLRKKMEADKEHRERIDRFAAAAEKQAARLVASKSPPSETLPEKWEGPAYEYGVTWGPKETPDA